MSKCITCKVKGAAFGLTDGTRDSNKYFNGRKQYCSKCCPSDGNYKDLMHVYCISCNIRRANFGLLNGTRLYCKICIPSSDYIDKSNKRCITCKKKRASFSKPGTPAQYCLDCNPDKVVNTNVVSNLCKLCKKTRASYGLPGVGARYCATCKPIEATEEFVSKFCIVCKTVRATFGLKKSNPIYCTKCKPSDEFKDVTGKKCIVCKDINATYALNVGDSPTHCYKHKIKDMPCVCTKRCVKCKIAIANYSELGKGVLYCVKCNPDPNKYYSWGTKLCITCNLPFNIPKSKQCVICRDGPIKTKEVAVKKILDNYGMKYISYNTQSADNSSVCGKYRPDFVISNIYEDKHYFIVIEVDENAHSGIDPYCEYARMVAIAQGLGSPTFFIRLNPDSSHKYKQSLEDRTNEMLCLFEKLERTHTNNICDIYYQFYNDKHNTCVSVNESNLMSFNRPIQNEVELKIDV